MTNDRKDVYTRVTDRIIADLERGVRTWMKPWRAENTAGRISRPLRHNGIPYQGMNVLLLWGEAVEKGYTAPIWLTYKQAQELGGNVRKPSGKRRVKTLRHFPQISAKAEKLHAAKAEKA